MGVLGSMWRALAVYRWASLAWAGALILSNGSRYEHPAGGYLVLAGMLLWTVAASIAYARGGLPSRLLLGFDLAAGIAALSATLWVETSERLAQGAPTLTAGWSAAPVFAWAIAGGASAGIVAGIFVGITDMSVHSGFRQATLSSVVLLLLAGGVGGYLVRAVVDAEDRLARAVESEAVARERERLARRIHDSVLQALALIHRRGAEIGGDAAALAEVAAEQEAALRQLVARQDEVPLDRGVADLTRLLESVAARASVPVQLSAPATAVMLPALAADEVAAAVAQALDNVARHAGAGVAAWLLVDDQGEVVTVSVRDEGVGFDPAELAAAEQAGRLGVAKSMRGRIEQLGGTMTIAAAPGRGVEVEFSVPR